MKEFHDEMISFIEKMARMGTIGPRDLRLIHVADSIEDAPACLCRHAIEPFGLRFELVPSAASRKVECVRTPSRNPRSDSPTGDLEISKRINHYRLACSNRVTS